MIVLWYLRHLTTIAVQIHFNWYNIDTIVTYTDELERKKERGREREDSFVWMRFYVSFCLGNLAGQTNKEIQINHRNLKIALIIGAYLCVCVRSYVCALWIIMEFA